MSIRHEWFWLTGLFAGRSGSTEKAGDALAGIAPTRGWPWGRRDQIMVTFSTQRAGLSNC
jgi:hypothetical protein